MAAPPSLRTETSPRPCAGGPLPSVRGRCVWCGGARVAALLVVVILGTAPQDGIARSVKGQYLPGDPRPTPEMGPPEVPPLPGPLLTCRVLLSSVLLARGFQVDLAITVGAPGVPAGTWSVRCAPRVAVNR
jgi:hypothetical protein